MSDVVEDESTGDSDENGTEAEPAGAVEPIRATVYEKIAAIGILALMAAAMVYVVWVVILYWNRVGV